VPVSPSRLCCPYFAQQQSARRHGIMMVHKELLLPCSWHVAFCHWLSCTHCLCIASTLHAPLPRSPTHFPANGPVLTAHAGLHAGISTITFSRPPALLAAVETCSDDGGPDVVAGGYSSSEANTDELLARAPVDFSLGQHSGPPSPTSVQQHHHHHHPQQQQQHWQQDQPRGMDSVAIAAVPLGRLMRRDEEEGSANADDDWVYSFHRPVEKMHEVAASKPPVHPLLAPVVEQQDQQHEQGQLQEQQQQVLLHHHQDDDEPRQRGEKEQHQVGHEDAQHEGHTLQQQLQQQHEHQQQGMQMPQQPLQQQQMHEGAQLPFQVQPAHLPRQHTQQHSSEAAHSPLAPLQARLDALLGNFSLEVGGRGAGGSSYGGRGAASEQGHGDLDEGLDSVNADGIHVQRVELPSRTAAQQQEGPSSSMFKNALPPPQQDFELQYQA